jgi:hypothetical protein
MLNTQLLEEIQFEILLQDIQDLKLIKLFLYTFLKIIKYYIYFTVFRFYILTL